MANVNPVASLSLESLKAELSRMQEQNAKLTEALAKRPAGQKREARVYVATSGSGYVCLSAPGARVYSFAPTDVPAILDCLKASGPLAEQARKLAESPEVVASFVAHKAARDAAK